MKKIFLAALIFVAVIFSINSAFSKENLSLNVHANESYLILLEHPAQAAMSSNTHILNPEILTTLYNEKNQIIVKTLAEGIARLYIAAGNDIAIVEFDVQKNDGIAFDDDIFPKSRIIKAIAKIDRIPEACEKALILDPPPTLRGEH